MPTEHEPFDGWDDEPTFPNVRTPRRASTQVLTRVLVAEDDPQLRALVANRLRHDGCEVIEAGNGEEAADILVGATHARAERLGLAIMDVRMPGMTGLEVVYLLRTWRCATPVLLVTAYPEPDLLDECRRLGVSVLPKPFPIASLGEAAAAAIRDQAP